MRIRMAKAEDLDTLMRVKFDYFSAEHWEVTAEKKALIAAQLQHYYPEHLNRDFFAALAEDDLNAIASVAFLVISERPANLSFPTGKIGTLLNVLTYPEYRHQGYATEILKLLIDEAQKQGLSYIELSASEMGKPLYRKLGFEDMSSSHFSEMRLPLL